MTIKEKYEEALRQVSLGLITKQEFMLIENEFKEDSVTKPGSQQLNG